MSGPLDTVKAYEEAAMRGDADAYVSLFDGELFWGATDREPIRSPEGLRTAIGGMFSRVSLAPRFTVERVDESGDMAVVIVHEGGTMTPGGGEPRVINLTEVFVLRLRGDSWKIVSLVWNSRGTPT